MLIVSPRACPHVSCFGPFEMEHLRDWDSTDMGVPFECLESATLFEEGQGGEGRGGEGRHARGRLLGLDVRNLFLVRGRRQNRPPFNSAFRLILLFVFLFLFFSFFVWKEGCRSTFGFICGDPSRSSTSAQSQSDVAPFPTSQVSANWDLMCVTWPTQRPQDCTTCSSNRSFEEC